MAQGQHRLGDFSSNTANSASPASAAGPDNNTISEPNLQPKPGQTIYSHSRLSKFESCPLQFKFAYIDEVETDVEETVESFLGSRVHEVLEKLYKDLKFQKSNTLQELLDFFNSEWAKNWNDNILIVRDEYDQENYHKMGIRFITDYYERYAPFDQATTIGLEMRILIKLDVEGKFLLQGYIDRLASTDDGTYEIHDYKTSNTLPEQEKVDADRQLALYSMAVKEKYRDCKKVVLIWHYLAFDKELRSERTDEQLQKLKDDTVKVINRIESATDYPAIESALCSWCSFQAICPRFKHKFELEKKTPEQYKSDDGVRLVNDYAALKAKLEELQKDLEDVTNRIMVFSDQMKIDKLFGSDVKLTVWKKTCVKFPGRMDPGYPELVKMLRESKHWDEFSTLDKYKLEKSFEAVEMDYKLMEKLAKFGKKELLKRLYVSKR
jgi:putative RecB family exonuclease